MALLLGGVEPSAIVFLKIFRQEVFSIFPVITLAWRRDNTQIDLSYPVVDVLKAMAFNKLQGT